ncbi:hypothetical protein Y695_02326 [Hydrogenophaga sp. T4]|nr:hypothetical protein Y695_02326 [Hydrogenophaga sp. T4]
MLAGDVGRVHQVARAARVGHDHQAVARPQQRGAHDLHVAVAVGDGVDAQAEELVLRVLRHDARIARAVELDAAPVLVGGQQRIHRLLDRVRGRVVAVFKERRHGVVDHLDQHVAHLVVHVHTAVDEGHTLAHRAGQLELEVRQAVVAHAAAEAHHRRFAHVRPFGQLGHRQAGKTAWIEQHEFAHPLFGGCQRGQGGFDAVEHEEQSGYETGYMEIVKPYYTR